jgi:hypothetical protein
MSLFLSSQCAGRVIRRFRGEEEAEPTEFDKVLKELGRRHEQEHLQSLGTVVDLSRVRQEERFTKTQEAIAARTAVIYQPAFRVMTVLDGIECEVVGYPDFLILDGDDEYIIRDSKIPVSSSFGNGSIPNRPYVCIHSAMHCLSPRLPYRPHIYLLAFCFANLHVQSCPRMNNEQLAPLRNSV